MASATKPGPMCMLNPNPVALADGTMCRCLSPLPGTVGLEPSVNDHFVWSDASKPLGQEPWFERRYPNLLEESRVKMVGAVNNQCQEHWGDPSMPDPKQRVNVVARDGGYVLPDGTVRKVKRNDD